MVCWLWYFTANVYAQCLSWRVAARERWVSADTPAAAATAADTSVDAAAAAAASIVSAAWPLENIVCHQCQQVQLRAAVVTLQALE